MNQERDTKFIVYSYVTEDNEPGTIIVHPDLRKVFDENQLFNMEKCKLREITLGEILEKGFIKIGSVDHMETIDIEYPSIGNKKPTIRGKYMHGSRRRLISEKTEIDFVLDPVSDDELVEWD